jgi:hypothetical protein
MYLYMYHELVFVHVENEFVLICVGHELVHDEHT